MFCPNCGQAPANQEIRFCPRCGFSFEFVVRLLSNGGRLPESELNGKQPRSRFTRRNGLKFALVWFLFFTLFLAPACAAADVEDAPEIFASLGVFGGLLIFVFSLLFLKKAASNSDVEQTNKFWKRREPNAFRGGANQNALPPQQSVPASAYVPPTNAHQTPDTFELNRPASVTEGTTKLLEQDK